MKIVAFVDTSLYAQSVIDHTAWLAADRGASIELVQVISPGELMTAQLAPMHPSVSIPLDSKRVEISALIPLSEIIVDFYNELKARTRGYASMDYTLDEYRTSDMVKLDILVNDQPVDALSVIVHRDDSGRDAHARQAAIGYEYSLSRRTDLYAAYGHIVNRGGAAYTVGDATNAGTGTTGINLGVRHVF